MKIGILTQPLLNNYGGLLQAYALKEKLQDMGHEVIIINRNYKAQNRLRLLAYFIKSKLLGRKINQNILLSNRRKREISRCNVNFKRKYIPNISPLICDSHTMMELNNKGFEAFIVGSDQCWRPKYSPQIDNYFLDFAENNNNIKRIAYAASFGVSDWEFNEEQSKRISQLAKKFDAISIREDSGIALVNKYLGVDAVQLIDPTMFFSKEHYINISIEEEQEESDGDLKVYVLDKTPTKQNIINLIEEKLGLKRFEVLPKKRINIDPIRNIEDFVYPNPAKWLRGFQDAKFVVTDSFHGTVFSIIFNIPFIAIANKDRGMARFESLLKMFNLEDRLISDIRRFDIETLNQNRIDWESINLILEREREKAFKFLTKNLN